MIRTKGALAAVLALAASSGCVTKPVVTLHHAEVTSASLAGVGLAVYLQVTNPNGYDVQIRNVHAEVTIAMVFPLPPIDVQPNVWLPAHQTTVVSVPVAIPWTVMPGLITQTLGAAAVSYHVHGLADVSGTRTLAIERNNYPVDEDGTLPRQLLVNFSSGGIHF